MEGVIYQQGGSYQPQFALNFEGMMVPAGMPQLQPPVAPTLMHRDINIDVQDDDVPLQHLGHGKETTQPKIEKAPKYIRLRHVKAAFLRHDVDDSKALCKSEFKWAMADLGLAGNQKKLDIEWNRLDINNDGKLTWEEFKGIVKWEVMRKKLVEQFILLVSFSSVVLFWYGVYDLIGSLPVEKLKERYIDDLDLDQEEGEGFERARLIELVCGFFYLITSVVIMVVSNVSYSGAEFNDEDDMELAEEDDEPVKGGKSSMCTIGPVNHRRFHIDRLLKYSLVGMLGTVAWLGLDLIYDAIMGWTSYNWEENPRIVTDVVFFLIAVTLLVWTGTMSTQMSANEDEEEQQVISRTASYA